MTENTNESVNWMTFHNIVNITGAHMLKLILKYRLLYNPWVFSLCPQRIGMQKTLDFSAVIYVKMLNKPNVLI